MMGLPLRDLDPVLRLADRGLVIYFLFGRKRSALAG